MSIDANLVSVAIGIIGGMFGVVIGALLQQRANTSQYIKQTTIDLYNQFNTPEMTMSRMAASDILADNLAASEPLSFLQLEISTPVEQWTHIERVRYFYERLLHLREAGYLDKTMARKFFGRLAIAWYELFSKTEAIDRRLAQADGRKMPQYEYNLADVRRLLSLSDSK